MRRLLLSLTFITTLSLGLIAADNLRAQDDLQETLKRANALVQLPAVANAYGQPGTYSSIRDDIANAVHTPFAKPPNPEIVADIKQFICVEEGSTSLIWRYQQIAAWQHSAGRTDESHATLREVLPLIEKRFLNPSPEKETPPCWGGEMLSDGEELARGMLALGSSDTDIRLAMKYAKVSQNAYRFEGTLASIAAEKHRHDLAAWLADRETLPLRRTRAWGEMAQTYANANESARAKHAVHQMQKAFLAVPPVSLKDETLLWLSELGQAMYGYGDKQLGIDLIEQSALGRYPGSMHQAIIWMNLGESNRVEACLQADADHFKRYPPGNHRMTEAEINREIEVKQTLAIAVGLSDYEEALTWIAKIPADRYERLSAVNGRVHRLLKQNTDKARHEARRLLEEHLPIYEALADKRPLPEFAYDRRSLPMYAEYLAQLGNVAILENRVLPKLTPEERKEISRKLPRYYNHLSLDEKLAKFIQPDLSQQEKSRVYSELRRGTNDPNDRKRLDKLREQLAGRAIWAAASEKIIAAQLHSPKNDLGKNRQLWEEALVEIEQVNSPYYRVNLLKEFAVHAWTRGYPDLTRHAAGRMIDVLWQTRDQEIRFMTPTIRRGWAEDAKLLLEEVNIPSSAAQ